MRTVCGIWARLGLLFCGTGELFVFFVLFPPKTTDDGDVLMCVCNNSFLVKDAQDDMAGSIKRFKA